MAKIKKKKIVNLNENGRFKRLNPQYLPLGEGEANGRSFIIKSASLKDGFCNYQYKIVDGIGIGSSHSVVGTGQYKEEMEETFGRLRVHMACIDDVFKHSGIEIEDIDKLHSHELTDCYRVTGFAIKGVGESEMVSIIGNKYVSQAGGRIDLKTPYIPLDSISSYKWYNELMTAMFNVRDEVAKYQEGNYYVEDTGEPINPQQLTIGVEIDARASEGAEAVKPDFDGMTMKSDADNMSFEDFENAKV